MIAVGVDTHKHEHLARAVDELGQILGGLTIRTDLSGYMELLEWLGGLGDDIVVGIEGAGSYGAPRSRPRCHRRDLPAIRAAPCSH